MSSNPSFNRPDQAKASFNGERSSEQPNIGMVSLGCPKALVDSERILTRLRAEGYGISPDYVGADAVIVNTCGFLDSAKAESLEAIGEAIEYKDGGNYGKANRRGQLLLILWAAFALYIYYILNVESDASGISTLSVLCPFIPLLLVTSIYMMWLLSD